MTKITYNIEKRLANSIIANKNKIKVQTKTFEGQVGKERDPEIEM